MRYCDVFGLIVPSPYHPSAIRWGQEMGQTWLIGECAQQSALSAIPRTSTCPVRCAVPVQSRFNPLIAHSQKIDITSSALCRYRSEGAFEAAHSPSAKRSASTHTPTLERARSHISSRPISGNADVHATIRDRMESKERAGMQCVGANPSRSAWPGLETLGGGPQAPRSSA